MKCAEVIKYCLSLPDSEQQLLNSEGTSMAFTIGKRPFAYFETGAPIQWQFSLQVTEALFNDLYSPPKIRQVEKGDGYWLTITRVENFADEDLMDMIRWSYRENSTAATCNA
ncbi:hypothetical protein [Halioxenophilus sp. WMMB6]|uniref:hypothetical protein n=1 Tax=Halioxenophilus sp. WMMB6 TaxID=3073815 RepID=UPI00295F55CB|nr:hypothetical protein [Halioxenophilus sp. WMMB6]